MIRATKHPIRRIVYGGPGGQDYVIEVRYDGLSIRPKGKPGKTHAVKTTWLALFRLLRRPLAHAVTEPTPDLVIGGELGGGG